MRYALPALALVTVLALTGCSSSEPAPIASDPASTPSTSAVEPSPTEEPAPTSADTLESVAEAAGITVFTRSTSAAPAAIAWGQGTLDGAVVKVYEFADDAGYQAFVESVAGFGITEDQLIHHGKFAIAPNDQTQLEQLRSALE